MKLLFCSVKAIISPCNVRSLLQRGIVRLLLSTQQPIPLPVPVALQQEQTTYPLQLSGKSVEILKMCEFSQKLPWKLERVLQLDWLLQKSNQSSCSSNQSSCSVCIVRTHSENVLEFIVDLTQNLELQASLRNWKLFYIFSFPSYFFCPPPAFH